MPYVTFAEVMEFLRGPNAMREILAGHAVDLENLDEDDEHPFFDEQELALEREVDDALRAAGLEYPLDAITDSRLRNASIYRMVDLLTRGASNRDPSHEELKKLADDYFARLAAGEFTIADSEPAASPQTGVIGRRVDVDLFDTADGILDSHMFPDLGSWNFRRR